MGFSQENGYIPLSIEDLMLYIMDGVNEQFGQAYTAETFIGTNFYKYMYATVQRLQENEVKMSEIFTTLQQYFAITNERISRPVVTNPGLLEKLENEGYIASIKKPIDADAGKIYVCVDTDELADDYDDIKLDICTIIKDSTVAGCVTQGTETEAIVLTNGQSFDFKFNLPDRTETFLRLTTNLSENNQVVILPPDEVKQILMDNILSSYRLGKNFEPQRYFSILDAPWAESVLLEWSDDEIAWHDEVFDAEYDEIFDIALDRITLVEA
jgi:hypothetical protein